MEETIQVSVDIEKLAKSVKSELELLPLSETCCIYRAPKLMRELNPKAYTPQLVSIGPFHYNKKELQPMQENKKRYLQFFLQRTETVSVQNFLQVIAKNEIRLRNCYSETIDLGSEEFVKMILVDSTFIIEFLLRLHYDEEDFLFNESCKHVEVGADLFLFENQIPFFILEELFNLCFPEHHSSLRKLALYFSNYTLDTTWEEDQLEKINFSEVKHLLDFLRICNKPSELHSTGLFTRTPTVKELHQAGVKFRTRPGKSIFDIKFSNGILEIPPLLVHKLTENLLRNLLVSEQCPGVVDNFFNDYICFMNLLANSPQDVELLVQKGIIDNWTYDSEKISILFRNLARTFWVWPSNFYYSDLVEHMNEFRSRRYHKWKAILKEKYFGNPWTIISFIGAVMLLILTLIQAVFSILH